MQALPARLRIYHENTLRIRNTTLPVALVGPSQRELIGGDFEGSHTCTMMQIEQRGREGGRGEGERLTERRMFLTIREICFVPFQALGYRFASEGVASSIHLSRGSKMCRTGSSLHPHASAARFCSEPRFFESKALRRVLLGKPKGLDILLTFFFSRKGFRSFIYGVSSLTYTMPWKPMSVLELPHLGHVCRDNEGPKGTYLSTTRSTSLYYCERKCRAAS